MAYCTLEDILDVMDEDDVIRYTDDDDTGAVNTTAVDKAIAGADALIDSHVASRHSVPLSPVPVMINSLACDIAVYKISSRRGGAPEETRNKFTDAVKFLEKVAVGKVVLQGAAAAAESASTDTVKLTSDTRIFDRSSMKGF